MHASSAAPPGSTPSAGPDRLLGCEGAGDDILVVDDSEASRAALEAALASLGRNVDSVPSGIEALRRLLEKDYALVILELVMPQMSGYEAAAIIRRRERSRETPIIFLTGHDVRAAEVLNGYELGCYDFLTKPVEPELLRAKVRVFLMLQDRTREIERQARELLRIRILDERMRHRAELDMRKDELLSTLAHELRTPLQSIALSLELLRCSSTPATINRARDTLELRVQQLVRLVDELLDISQLSTSTGQLHLANVNIGAIVRTAVAAYFDVSDRVVTADASATAHVCADERRLVKCVRSLIERALAHTRPGGHIHIKTSVAHDVAIVQVKDDGDGIDPKLLPRIFELAVRERGAKSGAGALELGLAYVKHAVELHGGLVSAHSGGVGRGSTFRIELPVLSR